MKLKCLIIDDEQSSIDLLTDFIKQIPYLDLIATTKDSFFALKLILESKIDLVITDINMPKLSGLGLFDKIKSKSMVIFVTGYSDLAIKSIEKNSIDLLMKPVSFQRFENATRKAFLLSPRHYEYLEKIKNIEIFQKVQLLTEREKGMIKLLAENRPSKEIADLMFISVRTVEIHRTSIRKKLDLLPSDNLNKISKEVLSIL
ncbi:response regulator transcription factor [Arcicella sp. DC2W]|uniref:Response regulator transcription factor n=1 Tax=Arcicella gelida TaxID=2984195 RepID=A0ABU5SAF6_9BACT|nr:response regulator transcription factor [Arcicella sp. DC2W]MEA5405472.1 response regulator transcription factor [Arcicella sp. DC2W]